jgi:predicted negative regulator of RcsB-dependent stress response
MTAALTKLVVALLAVIALMGYKLWVGPQPTIQSDAEAYYRVFNLFKEACDGEHGELVINLQDGHPGCNAK